MTLIKHINFTLSLWWQAWLFIGSLISWVMTRVILIFLFYGVVTPIALGARMVGKRFLNAGYWNEREKKSFTKEDYERQF